MINHIWIIKNSGENLFYKKLGIAKIELSEDLISGFFVALNEFAKESGKGAIDSIVLKDEKFIYMNFGSIYLVVGCNPSDKIDQMKVFMSSIGNRFLERYNNLENWDGDIDIFNNFSDVIDKEYNLEDPSVMKKFIFSEEEIEEEIKRRKKYLYKTVIVGNSRVGKTSILTRFAEDKFVENYQPTLGVDILRYSFDYNSHTNFTFTAWDVSGQKSFKSLRRVYYPNAESFVIIYDISDSDSFEDVKDWIDEIKHYGNRNGVFLLVGNKKDLENQRVIPTEKGQSLANEFGFDFIETSAKTGQNVRSIFHHIGEKIVERKVLKN